METRNEFGSSGIASAALSIVAALAAPAMGQVTSRVSVASSGAQSNGYSYTGSTSADGRYVTFWSFASNLVVGDTNSSGDVFVRDRHSGATQRVSVDSAGIEGNSFSSSASISADGRYVAFWSQATNLVLGDNNGVPDVFVHDRQSGTTELVSVDSGGVQGNGDSAVPSLSADGRYVAFWGFATNLVSGDTNACGDVFVRDRQNGTTERVSLDSAEVQGNSDSADPSISADGRFVAFWSYASNLDGVDTDFQDAFVRDRQSGTTERVSVNSAGAAGNSISDHPSISADGRYVAFWSFANNLVAGDTNNAGDIYVHDRDYSALSSLCDPGTSGVIACPCSNPPGGFGRGCDNSSGTGGAILSASGVAYLSMDTLVFTTSGEKPSALSIVLQGNASFTGGIGYGQGIRCVGGTSILRLFTRVASAGSITAPDFGAGDLTVSAQSAAKGDVIGPGQRRWYLVYYRDPTVLGGCSPSGTFNATQTGEVTWIP